MNLRGKSGNYYNVFFIHQHNINYLSLQLYHTMALLQCLDVGLTNFQAAMD